MIEEWIESEVKGDTLQEKLLADGRPLLSSVYFSN